MLPLATDGSESCLRQVRAFAAGLHAGMGQTYGGHPYVRHLDDVEGTLINFGVNEDLELLVAAYLHDALEDTRVGEAAIAEFLRPLFGSGFSLRVCALVDAVTDGEGATREERKAKTYPRILAIRGARRLKLADRIANVERCREEIREERLVHHQHFDVYQREHPSFLAGLRLSGPSANVDDAEARMVSWLTSLIQGEVR